MKIRGSIILIIVIILCLGFSGCSSLSAVDDAKALLEDYSTKYNENDLENAIMTFHSSLVEDLGGKENADIIMQARRALLGELTSYEVTNTSFKTVNNVTEVVLTVVSQYQNSKNAEDTYTFLTVEDGLYITGVNFAKETIVDDILYSYYKNYANPEAKKALYVPFALDQIDEDYINLSAQKIENLSGDFKDYIVLEKEYATIPFGDNDGTCLLILTLKVNYENMSFISNVQISEECGMIGVNYEDMIPADMAALRDEYFKALQAKDAGAILTLYSDEFFGQLTDNTKESWTDDFITPLLSNYGILLEYDVAEWDYDTVDVLGTMKDVYIMYSQLTYDNYMIKEKVIFGVEDGKILGHFLKVSE